MARAVLSALAGGGLTGAGLAGGALTGGALGASFPSAQQSPSDATPTVTAPADRPPSAPERFEAPKVRMQRTQKITGALDTKHEIAENRGRATPRKHIKHRRTRRAAGRTHALRNTADITAGVGHQLLPPPPVLAAERLRALMAELAFSGASARSLAFYRIPLFLLPIYRAAAARYGVPWRILAAINEVETDYGNDESVSTAGAVGWMQFMPETWTHYGVDALSAGHADPYNPVDAIFAAARYLRDMGAAKNLRAAIFAYNHSAAYVESVMLRAELISTYPKPVIATLTGLADGRLPVTSGHVAWGCSIPGHPPRRRPPPPMRGPSRRRWQVRRGGRCDGGGRCVGDDGRAPARAAPSQRAWKPDGSRT